MSAFPHLPSTPEVNRALSTRGCLPQQMEPSHQPATLSGKIVKASSKAVPTPSPAASLPAFGTIPADAAKEIPQTNTDEELAELHLRGGALLKRRPSNEKIPHLVWFLAGGMGKPPTGRELKDWKKKDREALVKKTGKPEAGFWGDFGRGLGGGKKKGKEDGGASAGATDAGE